MASVEQRYYNHHPLHNLWLLNLNPHFRFRSFLDFHFQI